MTAPAGPAALLPVGRDCDCGHPLVWHGEHQWCSVYGSHPVFVQVHFRDRSAPFAGLIEACMATPNLHRRAVYAREYGRRDAAARRVRRLSDRAQDGVKVA